MWGMGGSSIFKEVSTREIMMDSHLNTVFKSSANLKLKTLLMNTPKSKISSHIILKIFVFFNSFPTQQKIKYFLLFFQNPRQLFFVSFRLCVVEHFFLLSFNTLASL